MTACPHRSACRRQAAAAAAVHRLAHRGYTPTDSASGARENAGEAGQLGLPVDLLEKGSCWPSSHATSAKTMELSPARREESYMAESSG